MNIFLAIEINFNEFYNNLILKYLIFSFFFFYHIFIYKSLLYTFHSTFYNKVIMIKYGKQDGIQMEV